MSPVMRRCYRLLASLQTRRKALKDGPNHVTLGTVSADDGNVQDHVDSHGNAEDLDGSSAQSIKQNASGVRLILSAGIDSAATGTSELAPWRV